MRILAFSDIHRNLKAAEEIVAQAGKADFVIGAGDFATAHKGLEDVVAVLSQITEPTILTPGNSETTESLALACRGWQSAVVLHGETQTIRNVEFFGLGGGIPVTPFGSWSYDFTEEQAETLLAPAPAGGIWVTHSPPYGVLDVSSRGKHLGSHAIATAAERLSPRLIVCGHIHASSGKVASLGDTQVVNAGPWGIMVDC